MADPHYVLENNPAYNEAIRALQDSDPARASTTFNPVLLEMLNNTHHVKKDLEALETTLGSTSGAAKIKLSDGKTVEEAIGNLEESKAELLSPTFTGEPKAPTPAASASDTRLATTAFVKMALDNMANELFQLVITFGSTLKGKAFTVSGAGFTTYNGTVPASLKKTVPVTQPNTTYTISCDGKSGTVATTSFFGVYPISIVSLEDATWAQIAAAVENGNVPSMWAIGSEKNITLTTGETLTLQIYGKNHDDLASGGKAALTFGLKNLMAANQQMDSNNTNAGGFTGSSLYTWLQDALYNSLPADLRTAIKSVNKKTSAGNMTSTINTNAMKIFLFSEVECFGSCSAGSIAGEGSQYPIFTDNTSCIKKQSNGAGSAYIWWERSPCFTYASGFCYVYNNGSASNGRASSSYGVCFGFCI